MGLARDNPNTLGRGSKRQQHQQHNREKRLQPRYPGGQPDNTVARTDTGAKGVWDFALAVCFRVPCDCDGGICSPITAELRGVKACRTV